ncbi:MAG: diguanylate cyclase [Lachnospiraceae bacterium]|nr:diguanylate cyclase [Lachnospiraceae bacterium]
MLIPQIYVFNHSSYAVPFPEVSEAGLHRVSGIAGLPYDEISLIITDKPQDLTTLDLPDRPRYFVFFGKEVPEEARREAILGEYESFPGPEKSEALYRRWIRVMVSEYQARLYKNLLQTLIDSSPDMIWFKDKEERHVILNRAFCQKAGKDADFCIGKQHPEIWDSDRSEYESSEFGPRKTERAVIDARKTMTFQEPLNAHGVMKQLTTYKTPVFDTFGKLLGTCGIGHDVTNFENMGKELDIFLSAFPYPVFFCDAQYEILRMNSAAERLFRGMRQLTNYRTWKDFFLNKENNALMNETNVHVLQEGANKYYYSVAERDIKDSFGNVAGYFCMLRDVSYQRMAEELMFRAANVDPLTEAYNRRYFYEMLDKLLSRPVTLLYMDLDHFKKVNDQYGHDKGDEILIETVKAIKQQFPGHQVVRLGGDEFALVIADYCPEQDLRQRLDLISKKIENLADPSVGLGVSIGYGATQSLKNVEEFIHMCDDRMYEVKNQRHAAR